MFQAPLAELSFPTAKVQTPGCSQQKSYYSAFPYPPGACSSLPNENSGVTQPVDPASSCKQVNQIIWVHFLKNSASPGSNPRRFMFNESYLGEICSAQPQDVDANVPLTRISIRRPVNHQDCSMACQYPANIWTPFSVCQSCNKPLCEVSFRILSGSTIQITCEFLAVD